MWKFTRIDYFSNIWVVGIPRQWIFSRGFSERFALTKVIVRGLGKKNLEFAIWWKRTWFLCSFFLACERGWWCPFFRPSGEIYIVFWWLLLVPNAWQTSGNGCIKNLRPLMRFPLGAFLAWMRLPFFSCSLFVSSNFSSIGTFLLSMCLKSPICLSRDIVWSIGAQKKAISGFERWKFVPYVEIY